jgi:hypothetical protein
MPNIFLREENVKYILAVEMLNLSQTTGNAWHEHHSGKCPVFTSDNGNAWLIPQTRHT